MRIGGCSKGYTIIEVMIVLAVSGVMFVSAIALISGKQNRTEFSTAVRDFSSMLNAAAANVSNGYFATTTNLKCTVAASLPPTITGTTSTGAGTLGSNGNCMFIGQVMRLPVPGVNDSYDTTPLIGAQYKGGSPINGFSQTTSDSGVYAITSATQKANITNGVTVGCVLYATSATAPSLLTDTATPCAGAGGAGSLYRATDALTFLTTFYGVSTQGDPTGTSSSQVNLVVPFSASTDPRSASTYTNPANYVQNPAGGIYICLQSGTTNQHAMLTTGGDTSQFASNWGIYSGSCN